MRTARAPFAALCLLAASAPPVDAAGPAWTLEVNAHGLRRAEVRGEATLGKARTPARLQLQCKPGLQGTLAWRLEIENANAAMKGFPFDDFEGPDAVAMDQALSTISIEGGMLHPNAQLPQTGYYHADRPNSFVLEAAADADDASDVALVADAIGPATTAVTWRVRDPRDGERAIEARFAATRGAGAVRSAMAGCGPAPDIDADTVSKLLGQEPVGSGLVDMAAFGWHAQALTGSDYDAFRAALAKGEPISRADGLLVAAGRGENGDAAVWMLDLKRKLAEAVLVRSGKAQRYRDEDAPKLGDPDSVREFLSTVIKQ